VFATSRRRVPEPAVLIFGIVYPSVAGLDSNRQSLYLNLGALAFLSFTAWLLVKNLMKEKLPPPARHQAAKVCRPLDGTGAVSR
jgi:hypothetical protein